VQKLDNIMLIPNDAIFNSYLLESGWFSSSVICND
jgi:hypothetical protein